MPQKIKKLTKSSLNPVNRKISIISYMKRENLKQELVELTLCNPKAE